MWFYMKAIRPIVEDKPLNEDMMYSREFLRRLRPYLRGCRSKYQHIFKNAEPLNKLIVSREGLNQWLLDPSATVMARHLG